MEERRAIAIVSGGMDSVTLAYWLKAEGYTAHVLSIDYGQRHRKELGFAMRTASRLGWKHDLIDLTQVGSFLKGSALTDAIAVPDGHYAEETMRITVVPNRNAIMLSVAYGLAVAENAEVVALGVHAGDHFIYPDCRPAFLDAFDAMEKWAVEGFGHPSLHLLAPFAHKTKADIATLGDRLGVPWDETWSCYKGGTLHCGTCGTCVERREAFALSGVHDPTVYDSEVVTAR